MLVLIEALSRWWGIEMDDRAEHLVDLAVAYYRHNHGFPYPRGVPHELWADFYKLQDSTLAPADPQQSLFAEYRAKELSTNSRGLSCATYFHPHIWDSHATRMKAPSAAFADDKLLRRSIRLALETNGKITDTSVRNKLKIVSGTQMCSNFRPAVAKAIYDLYAPQTGNVLDPSSGYGGRLLGFLASKCRGKYVGVDPVMATCQGNRAMATFFDMGGRIDLIASPFEDVPISQLLDYGFQFAFTSPPYFAKEIYASDDRQSAIRYPVYREWLDSFWGVTLHTVRELLPIGAYFVVNIQDVRIKSRVYPLVNDTLSLATANGFGLSDRLEMQFSGFGRNLDKWKAESVLVLERRS